MSPSILRQKQTWQWSLAESTTNALAKRYSVKSPFAVVCANPFLKLYWRGCVLCMPKYILPASPMASYWVSVPIGTANPKRMSDALQRNGQGIKSQLRFSREKFWQLIYTVEKLVIHLGSNSDLNLVRCL